MRARAVLLGLLVLVIGLCAGCSSRAPSEGVSVNGPTASSPTDYASPGSTRCPSGSKDPAITQLAADSKASTSRAPLSADFDAVAAVRCVDEVETIAGDGTWNVALGQRATSSLSALITALRTPSTNASAGSFVACSAIGIVTPLFALVDAQGRITRPGLPEDVCGQPRQQALNAVNAVPWKTETEQKLSQVQTQAELETGCPSAYKDDFSAVPSATPWATVTGPTTACEYTVSSTPSSDDSPGLGEFSHGVKLDGARRIAIAAALTGSGSTAAKACSAQASKFVLLMVSPSEITVVELDGCQRMSYPDYYVAQAPSSLLTALRAAGF